MNLRQISVLLFLFLTGLTGTAQKRPLDHSVYDGWQSISTADISKDGQFIYYIVSPQEGDAQLVITDQTGNILGEINRAANARFSPDGKFLVALIRPLYQETRAARIKKKKNDEMPKDSLAIFSFATKTVEKIPSVKSYQMPDESGEHLAYLTEQPAAPKDTTRSDTTAATKKTGKKPSPSLHIRHLASGADTVLERIDNYHFSKSGEALVYIRTAAEKDSIGADAGLYYHDLKLNRSKHISTGKGQYRNIAFDEKATQLAFAADKSPEKSLQKAFSLYYYKPDQDSAIIIVDRSTAGVPANWYVSGEGNIRFSQSGEKLYFGIAPIPLVKDTTLVEFEHANVDIWHWQDDYLQPQQLVNLKREQNRSYLAVTYPREGRKVIPLADQQLPDVHLTEDADNTFVVATTDVGRRIETQWQTGSYKDIYLVSTTVGTRRKIADGIRGTIRVSPTGRFVVWFDRLKGSWHSHDVESGRTVPLNDELPVSFADEDNDVPDEPNDYGIAGWNSDGKEVFVNDKYDIWAFELDGSERRLVTNGAGRSNQITFRYADLQRKTNGTSAGRRNETIIDAKQPMILSAFNHISKESGWYINNRRPNRDPNEIITGPFRYGQTKSAENAEIYIYTKENYLQSPDLYVSADLATETKLSNLNPQQQSYNWGTAELMKWTTPHGYAAEGILYKPEDFNPAKKYPVIAYFYEELSDGLYSYIPPTPTPSRLNISFFVSNGYIVLAPDIRYEIGYPGRSAEEYVNSGMDELKKQPWVAADKMGIQGQSWGGYQVAHLITRTNQYAAAWAGAPVVNMTSAYGGIRWQTGMNRQFQYERTQSRIGATLWENPQLYLENSPLFHLTEVSTPVVIMSNDADGAVPWYQGIEMFTALRRLQKPVWLLNYNNEAHNLMERQNRKDIQRRQMDFFDHFLMGKQAAPWIEKGVPAILKGIDWGFENQ